MARIRTIKPTAFLSETLARCTLEAERTFFGLWTHCDDEGRCIDNPRLVHAALWALRDRTPDDVARDLKELADELLITRYEAGGRRYLMITNWAEHQKIARPTPSRIPGPDA